MYGAEVKLDTLSDTDRTGTKDEDFFAVVCLDGFVFAAEYRIVVRCLCGKFCGTGIYHFVGCCDAVCITHVFDLFFGLSGQACDHVVREFDAFCFF